MFNDAPTEIECFAMKCYCGHDPHARALLINERGKVFHRGDVIARAIIYRTTQACTCGLHNFAYFAVRDYVSVARRTIRYIYAFPHVREIGSYYRIRAVRVAIAR